MLPSFARGQAPFPEIPSPSIRIGLNSTFILTREQYAFLLSTVHNAYAQELISEDVKMTAIKLIKEHKHE